MGRPRSRGWGDQCSPDTVARPRRPCRRACLLSGSLLPTVLVRLDLCGHWWTLGFLPRVEASDLSKGKGAAWGWGGSQGQLEKVRKVL